MSNCAVVQLSDGLVVNKIVAEPTDLPPMGCQLILIDGVACDLGWVWNGDEFIDPNPLELSDVMPSGEGVDGD